jgi:predicted amidophosphoribosyltransferase
VRGSFEVRQSVQGERLILVDDVMTTGATLEALTRCLLAAGARSVSLALLARTP